MSNNCKCGGKKPQRCKSKDKNQSRGPLTEMSAQEAAALAELSADELNALLDGRNDAARGL